MIDVPDHIQNAVAKEFSEHYPEWHGSANNAAALRRAVEQLVEAGHNYSVDTVSLAFHHLNASGSLEQPEDNTVTVPNDIADAESLSDSDLEKLIRSKGVYVTSRSTMY